MAHNEDGVPNHLPLHEGPFVPGCLDVMSGFGEESVYTRLWYPSSLTDVKEHSSRWPRWLEEIYNKGFASVLGIWPIFLKLARHWWSGDMHIPAVWGADLVSKEQSSEKLPFIIFSHGLGTCRYFYSTMCLQLASHGILVAAMEHRDESSAATFFYESEKKFMENKKSLMYFRAVDENIAGSHLVIRKRQLKIRADECSRGLDFLISVNDGQPVTNLIDKENSYKVLQQLKGRLDVSTVSMMGHSFGGATALVTGCQDNRFKQLLMLDAWLFGLKNDLDMPEALSKFPKFFLNAEYFQLPNNLEVMRRFLRPGDTKVTLKQATHEHQSDSPLVVGLWLNRGKVRIDSALGMKINYHLVLKYLKERIGDTVHWNNQQFLDENNHHVVPEISPSEHSRSAKL